VPDSAILPVELNIAHFLTKNAVIGWEIGQYHSFNRYILSGYLGPTLVVAPVVAVRFHILTVQPKKHKAAAAQPQTAIMPCNTRTLLVKPSFIRPYRRPA
jgi:hypothetical protein